MTHSNISELYSKLSLLLDESIIQTPLDNQQQFISNYILHTCEYCNTINSLIYDSGMIVCNSCGEINKSMIDNSQEWNNYDNQSNIIIRCGHPVDSRNENLSIGTSIEKSYKYYNLIRTHIYITGNYKCKTILDTDSLIENKANKLNIPKAIIEDIKHLYYEINNIQISRGHNREAFLASCIYLTCQKKIWLINIPKLLELFNITSCDLTNANKKIPQILHSKQIKLLDNIKPLTPYDYIPSFIFKLNINPKFEQLITIIIKKIIELPDINQNTPQAITCAVIYLINNIYNLNITLEHIDQISTISYNTVKNCYKKIYSYKDILISSKLKHKLNISF